MAWRNNKRGGKPANREQQMPPFWVTCKCGEKVSAPAEWVFKYLDRIGYEAGPKQED